MKTRFLILLLLAFASLASISTPPVTPSAVTNVITLPTTNSTPGAVETHPPSYKLASQRLLTVWGNYLGEAWSQSGVNFVVSQKLAGMVQDRAWKIYGITNLPMTPTTNAWLITGWDMDRLTLAVAAWPDNSTIPLRPGASALPPVGPAKTP